MYRIYALPIALMLTCSGPIGVAAAADVAILMPGSSGIVPGDFLVRNEANFKRAGIRTILTTSPSAAAQAVAAEAAAEAQVRHRRHEPRRGRCRRGARRRCETRRRRVRLRRLRKGYSRVALPGLVAGDAGRPPQPRYLQIHIAGRRQRVRRLGARQGTAAMDQHHRRTVVEPLQCAGCPWIFPAGWAGGRCHRRLYQVALGLWPVRHQLPLPAATSARLITGAAARGNQRRPRATLALRVGTPNSVRHTSASAATPSRISSSVGLAKQSRIQLLL